MTDTPISNTQFARELWRRLESIHAVTYFAPETMEGARSLGVHGFWRAYFGFRAAPLGACSAGVVTAAFFGFSPAMVARAIPSVWELASPVDLINTRGASAAAALRRIASDELSWLLNDGWPMQVLSEAIANAKAGHLPLFLANRDVSQPDDPVAALWQAATALREQRGDSHVATWTAMGFTPIEVAVLFVAAGGTTREALQPNRGWSDDQWSDTSSRLSDQGLLTADHVTTAAGNDVIAQVESTTDTLAWSPFAELKTTDQQRLLDALEPISRVIAQSETIPTVNPMGVRLIDDR